MSRPRAVTGTPPPPAGRMVAATAQQGACRMPGGSAVATQSPLAAGPTAGGPNRVIPLQKKSGGLVARRSKGWTVWELWRPRPSLVDTWQRERGFCARLRDARGRHRGEGRHLQVDDHREV